MTIHIMGIEGPANAKSPTWAAAVILKNNSIYNGMSKMSLRQRDIDLEEYRANRAITLFDTPIELVSPMDEYPAVVLVAPESHSFVNWNDEASEAITTINGEAVGVRWFSTYEEFKAWAAKEVWGLVDTLRVHMSLGHADALDECVSDILLLDHRNPIALALKAQKKGLKNLRFYHAILRPEDRAAFDDMLAASNSLIQCCACFQCFAPKPTTKRVIDRDTEAHICRACFDDQSTLTLTDGQRALTLWEGPASEKDPLVVFPYNISDNEGNTLVAFARLPSVIKGAWPPGTFRVIPFMSWFAVDAEGAPLRRLVGRIYNANASGGTVRYVIIN